MQRLARLVATERAGASLVEEAWPTQTGNYEDGAGGDGVLG